MSVTSEGVKTVSPRESRPVASVSGPSRGGALRARYFAGILVGRRRARLVGADQPLPRRQCAVSRRASQIAAAIYDLAVTGQLWHHVGVSAAEFALGYVIASILGIALGIAMASSATMKQALQPWVSGLYATPTIALAPLFILWFGIGIWSKVIVVITLVLFPVAINTEAACAPPASG